MASQIVLTLNDGEQVLDPGDAVTVRAGTLRRWHNRTEKPARILIVGAR